MASDVLLRNLHTLLHCEPLSPVSNVVKIIFACFCMCGCGTIPHIEAPGTDMKYSYFIEGIPVLRPSTWNSEELASKTIALAEMYRKGNIVTRTDETGAIKRSAVPLTDSAWLKSFRGRSWFDNDWNFDPGTTADVYLKGGKGDAPTLYGEVVFMKGGERLGFRAIAGGSSLLDYYRDMKKLGIYIP